jgi:hypothetical protein
MVQSQARANKSMVQSQTRTEVNDASAKPDKQEANRYLAEGVLNTASFLRARRKNAGPGVTPEVRRGGWRTTPDLENNQTGNENTLNRRVLLWD